MGYKAAQANRRKNGGATKDRRGAREGVGDLLPLGAFHRRLTRQWQKVPDPVGRGGGRGVHGATEGARAAAAMGWRGGGCLEVWRWMAWLACTNFATVRMPVRRGVSS